MFFQFGVFFVLHMKSLNRKKHRCKSYITDIHDYILSDYTSPLTSNSLLPTKKHDVVSKLHDVETNVTKQRIR